MKHIYIYFSLMLTGMIGYAQGENDKWYFGANRGVNFTPATPTALFGGQISTPDATATVSNANGAILFYTNGVNVWNRQHQLMTNGTGLLGSVNTQQVVIAPYPGSTSRYYIFTMGIATTSDESAYSIVDMSLGAIGTNGLPLGAVTDVKNVPLLDQNGSAFLFSSENAALVAHSDNKSYWLLFYNNEQIFSYRIDSAGLNPVPVVSSIPAAPLYPGPYSANVRAHIRVSPTLENRPYSNLICISRSGSQNDDSMPRVISFDNATGTLTNAFFWSTITFGFEATEFSEDGDILYGINDNGTINYFDLTWVPGNPSLDRVLYWGTVGTTNAYIQKAKNGEIYTSHTTAAGNSFLGRISNQNDITNIGYNAQALNVGNYVNGGLPPLIPILDGINTGCWANLTLGVPEVNNVTRQVSASIVTNSLYRVNSGTNVNLKAGSFVLMLPNTTISNGAVFTAEIDGCTPEMGRPAPAYISEPVAIFKSAEDLGLNVLMTVYPNPATDIAKVSLSENTSIKDLTVYTKEGRMIFSVDVDNNTYDLDVSNFDKGIYIINLTTEKGEVLTSKVIRE